MKKLQNFQAEELTPFMKFWLLVFYKYLGDFAPSLPPSRPLSDIIFLDPLRYYLVTSLISHELVACLLLQKLLMLQRQ
jgi:hypothetical protein